MTPFKDNITKSIDNLNKLQEDVENTITDLQEQVVDLEEQIEEMEDLETKNVTITTNTETTIEPTTGKYALDKVVVTTNVQPNLEEKSVTITENKETTITPSENYQGLSSVVVTTNVAGGNCVLDFSKYTDNYSLDIKRAIVEITKVENISTNSNFKYFGAFNDLINLRSLPANIQLPSNIERLTNTFKNCNNLVALPNMNTENILVFQQTFSACSTVTSIPNYDFSHATTLNATFQDMTNLTDVPIMTLTSLTTVTQNTVFDQCTNLSNTSLQNILKSLLTLTSAYTGGKTLRYWGLTSTQATTCTSFDEWTTLVANSWTTGY